MKRSFFCINTAKNELLTLFPPIDLVKDLAGYQNKRMKLDAAKVGLFLLVYSSDLS